MQYRKRYLGLDKRLTAAIVIMLMAPAICAAGFILAVFWKTTLLLIALVILIFAVVFLRGGVGIPG